MPPEAGIAIGSMSITWDIMLFVGLLVVGMVYGFAVGRDRAVTILLSTYLALAVVTNAPILARLSQALNAGKSSSFQLVWFLGIFLLIFGLLWRSHLLKNLAQDRGAWWETALFSITQVGLLVSIAFFLLPPESTSKLSPFFQQAFIGEIGRSFWLIAPIPLLYIIGREVFYDDDEDDG